MSAAHAAGYVMAVTEAGPIDDEPVEAPLARVTSIPAIGVRPTGTALVPARVELTRASNMRDWLSSLAFGRATA